MGGFLVDEEDLPKNWRWVEATESHDLRDGNFLVCCPYCQKDHALWGLLDLFKDRKLEVGGDNDAINGPDVRDVLIQRFAWLQEKPQRRISAVS